VLNPVDIMVCGGYATWLAAFFGILILLLIVVGFFLAFTVGRAKPFGAAMKTWSVLVLALGFLCALAGLTGTFMGLANVFAYVANAPPAETAGALATGVYEANFNFIVGFFFALLSLFGWAVVRTVAGRG